jgi:hypothetical protein
VVLKNGEPLLLSLSTEDIASITLNSNDLDATDKLGKVKSPVLVLGDGTSKVSELVENGKIFASLANVWDQFIPKGTIDATKIQPIKWRTDNDVKAGVKPVSEPGTNVTYARSDHVHALEKHIPYSDGGFKEDGTPKKFETTKILQCTKKQFESNTTPVSAPGDSLKYARADHVHALEKYIPSINEDKDNIKNIRSRKSENKPVTISKECIGESIDYARADHTHYLDKYIPAAGGSIKNIEWRDDDYVNKDTQPKSSAGTSSDYARADHTHALTKHIPYADKKGSSEITTITIGAKKSSGDSLKYARADHVHAFPITVPQLTTSTNSRNIVASIAKSDKPEAGISTYSSRSDHTHILTKDVVLKALDIKMKSDDAYQCLRKITVGKSVPSNSEGKNGDIFIKID